MELEQTWFPEPKSNKNFWILACVLILGFAVGAWLYHLDQQSKKRRINNDNGQSNGNEGDKNSLPPSPQQE